jgi:hypothetical protein
VEEEQCAGGKDKATRGEDKARRGRQGIGSALELGGAWTDLQQEVARAVGTAAAAEQRAEGARGGRERGFSQGLVCSFRELQGPLGKEEFNHCFRA